MKKLVTNIRKETTKEIEKEIQSTREEIAKFRLEAKVSPIKDTNLFIKKKKKLAVLLTILTEKNSQ